MKIFDRNHSGDQSCSCTSCAYRTESDRPSLKRIISQGNRIDRLYYGKYIPLREKKLLDKLVRTRGVYDDIRAKILSDSTLSLDKKAISKPQRKLSNKNLDDAQKKAISELVNLVDRGLGSKELSGCCSCCSCSSKINIRHQPIEKQRHKRAPHIVGKNGRSRRNAGENISRKGGVRFKAKHIRSEPCTCTYKLSGMFKNVSKGPPLVDLQPPTYEEINERSQKNRNLIPSHEILQQYESPVKEVMAEGIRDISASKTNIQEKIDVYAKKSLEKLRKGKDNLKQRLITQKKKGKRPKIKEIKDIESCMCPETGLVSRIKKDSISKFKDDLKRKQISKMWECERECVEDICFPEECYYRIKHKHSRYSKRKGYKNEIIMKEKKLGVNKPDIKISSKKFLATGTIKQKTKSGAQKIVKAEISHTTMKERKPKKDTSNLKRENVKLGTTPLNGPVLQPAGKIVKSELSIATNAKERKSQNLEYKKINKMKKNIKNIKSKHTSNIVGDRIKTGTTLLNPPGITTLNKNRANILNVSPLRNKKNIIYQRTENLMPERKISQRQAVRIGSSFSFNIEFYKKIGEPKEYNRYNKTSEIEIPHSNQTQLIKLSNKGSERKKKIKMKDSKTGEANLKRCVCTRKMKCKKNKIKTPSKPKRGKSLITQKSVIISCSDQDCAIDNWCEKVEYKIKNPKLANVETNTYYTTGRNKFKRKQPLLPYECEPGICDPDTCCPYKCLKLINLRKEKSKMRSVQCPCPKITRSHKTQSSSSLTSKSCASLCIKPKGVKSMVIEKCYTKHKLKNPEPVCRNICNINTNGRQAVRIGSTFSFNLEFYKDQSPHGFKPNHLINITTKPNPNAMRNKRDTGDRNVQKKLKHKRAGFGTTLKRCFCTLKLQDKRPINKKQKMHSAGTDALDNNYYRDIVLHNKSTKTKKSRLVCIPGNCDPNECLERLNRLYLKEIGSITEPDETKDVSSTTYSKKSFKSIHVQSKPLSRNYKSSAKTNKKRATNAFKDYYSSIGKSNQVVKIGSSFSFDIEFFKNTNPGNVKLRSQSGEKIAAKKNTSRGNKINKLNVAYVTTQVKEDKKLHKASMANNLVKRCFCTLNLQKYRKKQNAVLPPALIYTVNRAMTEEPIFTTKKNTNRCQFNSNLLTINNGNKLSIKENPILPKREISATEERVQYFSSSASILSWKSSFTFFKNDVVSASYLQQTDITNLSRYIRNCFCSMNVQLARKNMPYKKPKSDKASVHLGSCFTFNVDFCKNSSISRNKNETTSDTGVNNIINRTEPKNNITYHKRQSQSAFNEMIHKTSATALIPRRCFCTLQLQKKGRHLKKKKEPHEVPKSTLNGAKSVSRAQNTNFKPLNIAHSLKPYKCEPGVCKPGHCDPYQCLDIMKRKKHTKESGVYTILQAKKSVSSITSVNESKGTQKSYARKRKTKKITSDLKQSEKSVESYVLKPSRQVVRVGSNFSFNIEFFKDNENSIPRPDILRDAIEPKQAKEKKKERDTFQKSTLLRHKETEIKKTSRVASTMTTSFMKRCFCTAKLRKPKKSVKLNLPKDVSSPTFMEKCTCFLQSIKSSFIAGNQGIHLKKVGNFNKKTNAQNKQNVDKRQLEPYECEPGICVPGECDPYVCEEIMKKNKMKRKSQLSNTEHSKSRPAFTHIPKGAKNVLTQSKINDAIKHTQFNQKHGKTKTSIKATDQQVVKIGSNFSFNIKFYKNHMSSSDKSILPRRLNSFSNENKKVDETKIKTETLSTRTRMIKPIPETLSTRTRMIKPIPVKQTDRALDKTHNLKRCFCTLRLHNQHSQAEAKLKEKKRNQDVKLKTKSVMTKKEKHVMQNLNYYECEPGICVPNQCDPYECEKIMKLKRKEQERNEFRIMTKIPKKFPLLPYECEPLTCVPGECNPAKCLERIKKRQYKNNGGTTKAETKYSVTTMTGKNKIKTKKNQIKFVDKTKKNPIIPVDRPNKDFLKNEKGLSTEHKQAVRIGSNFSFKVEFYKDRHMGNDIKYKEINEKKNLRAGTSKMNTNKENTNQIDKKNNNVKGKRNTSSFLKKCFCVLKLHKMRNKKQKHTAPLMNDATTKLQLKYTENVNTATQYKLLPYECEPNVCVPGECDPYECEKLIKKRISKKTGTDLGKSKVAATRRIKSKSVKLQGPKVKLRDRQQNKTYENIKQNEKLTLKTSEIGGSKQVVRIGSQFSFDIEIFKNQYSNSNISTRKTGQIDQTVKKTKNDVKKKSKQNKIIYTKKQPKVTRGLSPFECAPFSCNPENCDPYKCEKKLHSVSTQMIKQYSNESVGQDNMKKDEYSITETVVTSPQKTQINQKIGIVKVPKFDKKLVKVGSNFSFNIEFYKERGQKELKPQKTTANNDNKNSGNAKNIHTKTAIKHSYGSQAAINAENKSLEAQNTLKRCFCTLKLQKNVHHNNRNKLNRNKMPQYPQSFDVRRVSIQQAHTGAKSVATKINKKYIKENINFPSPCNCREYINGSCCRDPKSGLSMNCREMQTILPYAPTKFKKNTSKTMLSRNNNFLHHKTKTTNHGKKLKKKKSLRNINCDKQLCEKIAFEAPHKLKIFKKIACVCVSLFSPTKDNVRKHKIDTGKPIKTKNMNRDHVKGSKSDRKPSKRSMTANSQVNKSKSLKLDGKYGSGIFRQLEDNEKSPSISLYVPQRRNGKIRKGSKSMKQIPKGDLSSKDQQRQLKNNEIRICDHCEVKLHGKPLNNKQGSSPLKVHFAETSNKTFFDEKSHVKKQLKHNRKCKKLPEDSEYCCSCGQKFNKEELKKGSGDRPVDDLNKKDQDHNTFNKIKGIFKVNKDIGNVFKSNTAEKPLFEMQISSDDYDIINKKEVFDSVIKLSSKKVKDYGSLSKSHKKSCRCCICLSKKNKMGANIHVKPKGHTKTPCICGSNICKTQSRKKIKLPQVDKIRPKTCRCGSPICDHESATMKVIQSHKGKIECVCAEEEKKMKKIKDKIKHQKENEIRMARLKQYDKEDKKRKRLRQKEYRLMEKRIDKDSSDAILLAESIIDIGKLGITAATDILRSVARIAIDPKHAVDSLKAMKDDPRLIARFVKAGVSDSGVASTVRRVRLRCMAMQGVKKIKALLESYTITRYLMYIAHKDPKRRALKPKKEREREQLDFGCSLYMGSLRKKPYLSIYNRFPNLYPHFLSLLNLWKQFTDVMLFLLAVFVWSPCILCTEFCRAVTCCFFCTG